MFFYCLIISFTISLSSVLRAIKENGTLWAWGRNSQGQLGIGSTVDQATPVQVGTDTSWVWVSSGLQFSTALKSDGTLWTWGINTYGQLGRVGTTNIPGLVNSPTPWKTIAAGGYHILGIKQDSSLWAWGRNQDGQLGNNTTTNSSSPLLINSTHEWWKINSGHEHSLAIKTDSTLWLWGKNANGQTGDTSTYSDILPKTLIPTIISTSAKWKEIDGGYINSIAIKSNGELNTTGYGFVQDGQLNHSQLGYTQLTPIPTTNCIICPNLDTSIQATICFGDTYTFNSTNYSTSGTYSVTYFNTSGCDSTVTLQLTVLPFSESTDTIIACDSYTWINGQTYTTSTNSPTFTLTNSQGCDSLVHLNLTILNSSSSVDSITSCDSYTWINGQTYTSSNTSATHILQNAVGCDSIIHLNLTIYPSYDLIDTVDACGSFSWIDGQTYFNSTNTPSVSYTTINGCDSTITLHLSIHPIYSLIDTVVSCGPYTWVDGNTYTSNTNTPTVFLTSEFGCDSTVTLNLTIETIDNSTTQSSGTLSATQAGHTYQWIDCFSNSLIVGETNQTFNPLINGSYAVIISSANCSDTSECIDFGLDNIFELNSSVSISPNPTNSIITVSNSLNSFKLKIMDLTGKTLIDWSNESMEHVIDLSSFQNGLYLIALKTEDKLIVKEIIKQ